MNDYNIIDDKYQANFTAALLKVASRCNLDCDYCYVYHHVDQTWRLQPKLMSQDTIQLFGSRLSEYVNEQKIAQFSIIFHGGEPLLFTGDGLVQAAQVIRDAVTPACKLDFSVQTNGLLLTDQVLDVLEKAKIGISISLDGPKHVNDLHRVDHAGKSSFEGTFGALQKLRDASSDIFQGVISVIDPNVSARELFEFFYPLNIPRLDLLLPDATHSNRSDTHEELYLWLNDAFELWYNEFSDLPIRFFDAILGSRLSIPSPTDALGFGAVNLLVVETDGTFTDHDVFKIAKEGINQLQNDVRSTSLVSLSKHPKIFEHAYRLSPSGVALECKSCPALEACGGGSIMHRYHEIRGFDAPTIYCKEMFSLLSNATRLLRNSLLESNTVENSNLPSVLPFSQHLVDMCREWRIVTESKADAIAQEYSIDRKDLVPAAALIMRKELSTLPFENSSEFQFAHSHTKWLNKVRIQLNEPWLSKPFEDSITVLPLSSEKCQHGIAMLDVVAKYLETVSPFLLSAISELISDILFVESTITEEAGIFSFSDDSAPNVLYISPFVGDQPLGPDDIADSILHEFLHHVLYHIELAAPLLFDYDFPRFPAPWRSGLRPSGGFLHGTFVFSGLSLFWESIATADIALPMLNVEKANENANKFKDQASYGLRSTYQFALLTNSGIEFVEILAKQIGLETLNMQPPGILNNIS